MIPKKNSKELLAESALELISKYPVDKISVSDIARNCNVSTRTFYNHFQDKYDLVTWTYIYLLEQRYKKHSGTQDFHSLLTFTVEVVWEYYDFFANIAKYHGQNNISESILAPLRNLYLGQIRDVYHDEITEDIYDSVTFFLYGCICFANHVLKSKNIPTPRTSVAFIENGMPSNLSVYLRGND